MKKIYLLFISFLIFLTSSTPFEQRTMEILTSYKWCVPQAELDQEKDPDEPDEPYMLEMYFIYTETTCTSYERWSDEPDKLEIMTVPYYIGSEDSEVRVDRILQSNGKVLATYHPLQFDDSKVEKNRQGNYILKKYGYDGEATILMIANFKDNKLILYSVTPEVAGGIITLEARPKD